MYTTLIAAPELKDHLSDPNWAIVDCRFDLHQPAVGRERYRQAHIPGAVYAHLDEHLSGPIVPGKTGRHPLPEAAAFAETVAGWGIDAGTQVVAYDDAGGMYAARLWWMLRWVGHERAAVLDGGFPAWLAAGGSVAAGAEARERRAFVPRLHPELQVSVDDVLGELGRGHAAFYDARGRDRYTGKDPGLDPIGGHIPGARLAHYTENLAADGRFLPLEELRSRWERLLDARSTTQIICYCGSGVTAAHNLLALEHAGFGLGRLYVGSWSEWIVDPARPIAGGDEPGGFTTAA